MAGNSTTHARPLVCYDVSELCTVDLSVYGYKPNLGANVFFIAIFALLCIANIGLGIFKRTWSYMVALSLASLAAAIGYYGRVLMHYNVFHNNGFMIQIAVLIISPAFNSAAVYLTLKHITLHFGPEFSRIKPALYTYIFIAGDFLSILLQAAGGAMAATASRNKPSQLKLGDNIMLAGVSWQVVCLTFFAILAADFVVRRWRAAQYKPFSMEQTATLHDIKFRLFAGGVAVSHLLILIRCIYRIAEMAGGWGSAIMKDEGTFIVCEGVLILVATILQTCFHPGFCFPIMGQAKKDQANYTNPTGQEGHEMEGIYTNTRYEPHREV